MAIEVSAAIESARTAAGLSQRALADRTGISQSTLNRILSGDRPAKMTEIIEIADAVGCTVPQLTGNTVADRVLCAARASDGASMATMRQRLLHFLELDAYLDDQGIPAVR
ncbi:helix-turn-helix transcriptional regulator [Gordonia sp. (in: high G+C Gram-positive bacteria)]|jgi:transcriptional regulator with XRE-family HTH domain|uniref:helix-turn-helix domain-containing protein n=1 Tax=Gordonia sp. (in: high G+C Gram-positive bacteria) TaxID=84139 RepID=UPI001D88AA0A|nr:helix-turn-helix transcriptional regulator [Gordonia sp. (in: high G+C Gram-positive bacteria)]MCB1295810.1 helix-turn-helix transcriptional regulator [Gordonia sp. (in: high G+C Gram-positive bacteria)]HMS77804.1 helix-turn-helix transcriptional regulator [Gordonia sp. (in: high G+C Gram-positive bacteria)]HQV20006.1 helix-turn-helix transcriptional regulator [Gordonia sp. (in: high G+C Gram-positive bacteria)]